MIGHLDDVLKDLLKSALPGFFSGEEPAVTVTVVSDLFEVDSQSADVAASEPRPDDRTDTFTFNAANPAGPYNLTQPPYPGPRRVYLTTDIGDRIVLQDKEVAWDKTDSRIFVLNPRPNRELTGVTGVEALYGVTAVFTKIKAIQTLTLTLKSSDANKLDQAEALAVAVISLNRQHLVDESSATYEESDYGALISVKNLKLLKGAGPAVDQRVITLQAEVELKATRALREDEGMPIERMRTPGRPMDTDHPIDIHIDVIA